MKPEIFGQMIINVVKIYTLKIVFWNDGMLAITFFETVRRDLKLVEYLSVWKESSENPVRLMTGSCVLCFINVTEISFEPSVCRR